MFISDSLDICDPVLTFDKFMEGIEHVKDGAFRVYDTELYVTNRTGKQLPRKYQI